MAFALLLEHAKPARIIGLGNAGPGGGDSHMKQTGMLVGNFEFNP